MKPRIIIAAILIPIIIFLFSAITVVYDKDFYTNEPAKLGSSETLVASHEKIADYLTDSGNLDSTLDSVEGLTAAEKSHLADVKDIMNDLPILFLVLLLVWLTLFSRIKEKRKILLYGGLAAAVIPLILYAVPFDAVFNLFHQIVFPQGNWIFAPDSLLIQIYPIQFFYDAAFRIFGQGFAIGALISLFSIMRQRQHF
jgi:integral membrane protein (TIGR01906 family)